MKTPIFNIHDIILILTLAVSLLLFIFQLLLSKQRSMATWFLGGFFIFIGLNAFCNLLLWNEYIHLQTQFSKVSLATVLSAAVIGKSLCLYFYVISTIHRDFTFKAKNYSHFLHGLLLVSICILGISSDDLLHYDDSYSSLKQAVTNFLWHYIRFLPIIYAFAAVVEVRRYKIQLQDFYSSFSMQGPIGLMLLTSGFAVNWLWSLAVHLLAGKVTIDTADSLGIFDNYISFILVNALFIYSLVYANQLLEANEKITEKETARKDVSAIDVQSVRDAMDKYQLYLKPNLNIEEFSRQVGLHYREVSAIINKQFNSNFFEFVNEYRVNKAKQMLQDPACSHLTIMDILSQCGFNSKSSFHRFFKRYTGMSAADFRKQTTG